MLHPKCPRHTKKNTTSCHQEKHIKRSRQKIQIQTPKYPNHAKKIPKYTQQNPKVPHTKKTSRNRWLLPSAQARLAHPRLVQTANTAALLQPGMAEDLLKIHSHRSCIFCVHTLIGSNCAIAIAIKLWLWGARLGFQDLSSIGPTWRPSISTRQTM